MKYTLPIDVESDLILEYFEKKTIKDVFERAISEEDIAEKIRDYMSDISDYLMTENQNRKPEDIIKEVHDEFLFNIKLNMFLAANSCVMGVKAFYNYERRLAKQIYVLSKDKRYLETIVNLCGEAILRAYMQHYNPEVFSELEQEIRNAVSQNDEKQQTTS